MENSVILIFIITPLILIVSIIIIDAKCPENKWVKSSKEWQTLFAGLLGFTILACSVFASDLIDRKKANEKTIVWLTLHNSEMSAYLDRLKNNMNFFSEREGKVTSEKCRQHISAQIKALDESRYDARKLRDNVSGVEPIFTRLIFLSERVRRSDLEFYESQKQGDICDSDSEFDGTVFEEHTSRSISLVQEQIEMIEVTIIFLETQ